MLGIKDVDIKILNELPDEELVNMCQVNKEYNKICNNDNFWRNRILFKYPELNIDILNKYKKNRTWSQYYIHDLRKINSTNAQTTLFNGIENGRLDWVIVAVENGANVRVYNDQAVRNASRNGHLDVVKYLVSLGAPDPR